ncbi:MAG: MgtC/SapB family protein, partial [Thermoanaerobaculia bacterium]|nr:MgtC/SapB family protein [Thermoanaerobaculia bacterium]
MAIVCGGAIGLERQLHGKPAGIRTSILICLATSTFIRLGVHVEVSASDPTRVLGQLVVGVGFLGAGVILNRHHAITGITSASVVWMLSAIGAALGFDLWGTAISLTAITLAVLVGIEQLERLYAALRRGAHARPPAAK